MNKNSLYHYQAVVISVYDGDTCRMDVDLGLGVWQKNEKIRLARINTPELRGNDREAGVKSRDALRELILDKTVLLKTIRDRKGKYGRYIGEIFIEFDGILQNVNDWLVENGFGEYV